MSATTSNNLYEIEAPVGVLQDSGNKVVVTICVPGLKKRQGLFRTVIKVFRKTTSPFQLASNAKFGAYKLDSTSLNFSVDVYEKAADLKKPPSETQKQRYICKIDKFPTRINAESAEFELKEGNSGDCYFILTCIKTENLSTNWKEFCATHGTLDASKI